MIHVAAGNAQSDRDLLLLSIPSTEEKPQSLQSTPSTEEKAPRWERHWVPRKQRLLHHHPRLPGHCHGESLHQLEFGHRPSSQPRRRRRRCCRWNHPDSIPALEQSLQSPQPGVQLD